MSAGEVRMDAERVMVGVKDAEGEVRVVVLLEEWARWQVAGHEIFMAGVRERRRTLNDWAPP